MRSFIAIGALAGLMLLVGCSGRSQPPAVAEPAELTLEKWKTLSVDIKYDAETLESLRAQDPQLHSDRAWSRFMREVVVAERKQDIPGVPGQ